jgi:hypothetical protein
MQQRRYGDTLLQYWDMLYPCAGLMAWFMQVKESLKLRQIMQTILTLGNALNQGTARGILGRCFYASPPGSSTNLKHKVKSEFEWFTPWSASRFVTRIKWVKHRSKFLSNNCREVICNAFSLRNFRDALSVDWLNRICCWLQIRQPS